jgi:hypothetical protein
LDFDREKFLKILGKINSLKRRWETLKNLCFLKTIFRR